MNVKCFPLVLGIALLSSCASSPDYDVSVVGKPILVLPFEPGMEVDVLEGDPAVIPPPKTVVTFKVAHVLKGDFTEKRGGPSQSQQVKEIFENKDVVRLLTLDIQDPNHDIPKEVVRVAVSDPVKTFSIADIHKLPNRNYRLHLKSFHQQHKSYILVKSIYRK